MAQVLAFDGENYIAASQAAQLFSLHRDYVSRLAREGKIKGRHVGRSWFVHEESLKSYVINQAYQREVRKRSLSIERSVEYANSTRSSSPNDFEITHSSKAVTGDVSKSESEVSAGREWQASLPISEDRISKTRESIHALLQSPAGITHAVIQTSHAPHFISPVMELLHKLFAVTLAVSVTFGTFAVLNPGATRVASESIRDTTAQSYVSMREIVSTRFGIHLPQTASVGATIYQSGDQVSEQDVIEGMVLVATSTPEIIPNSAQVDDATSTQDEVLMGQIQ